MSPEIAATSLSLRRNFSWTLAGNAFFAASQWLLLVLLARLGSSHAVGQYALATAITTPIVVLMNLKLRSVLAADALEEFPFGLFLSVRLLTIPVGFTSIALLALALGYRETLLLVVIAMAVAKALESVSDIYYGLQQRHERMNSIAMSMIVKGVLSTALFTGGFVITESLLGGLIGMAVAWAATLLLVDLPMAKQLPVKTSLHPRWKYTEMLQLIALSAPLGLTVSINSVATNVPRYFVDGLMSTGALGVFAAISYTVVAGNMIIAAIGQAVTPRLASLYRTGRVEAHLALTLRLLALGSVIGLAGVLGAGLFGQVALEFVYGGQYAAHTDVLLWIMVNALIGYAYVFLGTALTSMRKFNVQLPVHLTGMAVLVAACWWMVPRWGLLGAAWAMLAANSVQAAAYGYLFVRYWRKSA